MKEKDWGPFSLVYSRVRDSPTKGKGKGGKGGRKWREGQMNTTKPRSEEGVEGGDLVGGGLGGYLNADAGS